MFSLDSVKNLGSKFTGGGAAPAEGGAEAGGAEGAPATGGGGFFNQMKGLANVDAMKQKVSGFIPGQKGPAVDANGQPIDANGQPIQQGQQMGQPQQPVQGQQDWGNYQDPMSSGQAPAPAQTQASTDPEQLARELGGESEGPNLPFPVPDSVKGSINSIFGFGKQATGGFFAKSSEMFNNIRTQVEEKTPLGEFTKSNKEFAEQQATEQGAPQGGVPGVPEQVVAPWTGHPNEAELRNQILGLSQDERNFLRAPPAGAQFDFNMVAFTPLAELMLQEDKQLDAQRFTLVPKRINEESFWRNYFYRVSLIRQSTDLLGQDSDDESTSNKPLPTSTNDRGSEKSHHSSSPLGESFEHVNDEGDDDVDEMLLLAEDVEALMNDPNAGVLDPQEEADLLAELEEEEKKSSRKNTRTK